MLYSTVRDLHQLHTLFSEAYQRMLWPDFCRFMGQKVQEFASSHREPDVSEALVALQLEFRDRKEGRHAVAELL